MEDNKKMTVIKAVVGQLCNMLQNDVIDGNGIEPFDGWCADGEVFEDAFDDEEMIQACNRLVKRVAPAVDDFVYKLFNQD